MATNKSKTAGLPGSVRVTPIGFAVVSLSWLALHQFGYNPLAMLNSFDFLVGLALGAALYSFGLNYHIDRVGRMDRSKEEDKFESVLKNRDKITFSRRVGDMVFMGYIEYSVVLNLKSEVLYIFHSDQCLATSNNIPDSLAVRRLREFISESFGEQINDCVTINGVAYSRQMIEFYTNYLHSSTSGLKDYLDRIRGGADPDARQESEQELSVDHILDKISKNGIGSLSREEMDFLKSQR